jgi:type I restriction enzyme S subunit
MKEVKLQRYPAYKDSGVEWLGEIPEHWDAVSLGSILELKSDKNHPDYEVLSVYREYGVIKKDSRDDNHNVTSLDTSNYKAVETGDLVVNKMKAWQGSMGVSPHKGIVSPAYITCRVNSEKIHPEYLHQLLRCDLYIGEYNRLSYGVRVGQWDMHYEDFKHITTTIPPIAEQTAIANFLDNKTTQIESAIAIKQKQIELLKERRQIVIHRAVTLGLNPDVKLKDSGVEWIGEIPKHWEVKQAKHQIESISNGTTEEQLEIFDESNSNFVPVTRIETISDAEINMNKVGWVKYKKILERYRLKSGDILFSHINSLEMVGKTAIYKGENELFAGMNLLRIRPKQITNADWLHWYLKTSLSRNYFTSVAKPSINQASLPTSFIGRYKTVVPPVDEQKEIVNYIETANTKISTAISLKEKEIEKLKEYKSVLINEVVSGKIKVG